MSKKFFIFLYVLLAPYLNAGIVEIDRIEDVRPYIDKNTLCLFDIDDTLIENPFSLGTPAWRNWAKKQLLNNPPEFVLYDALTLYIAKHAAYVPVEPTTVAFISELQNEGITALALTSRGRSEWYTTQVEGIDRFTHEQLRNVGIDFGKTEIPQKFQNLDPFYFNEGIIFTKLVAKGECFKELFQNLIDSNSTVVFVDDKFEHVKSVVDAVEEMGIPCYGFWYRYSDIAHADFDPKIANVELEYLVLYGQVLTDSDAKKIVESNSKFDYQNSLEDVLKQVNVTQFAPNVL